MRTAHSSVFRKSLVALTFAAMVIGSPLVAQTPTERVANCINGSWASYKGCIDGSPWYIDQLCVIKFEADAIGCALEILPM